MFKIGEFSNFSRVSVKMLRHYDELGLLKPAHVDRFTNYRYYSADQLPRLNRIVALKDLGFTLEQIGQMLDGEIAAVEIQGMLKLRRAEIERTLREEEAKLGRIEARLAQIRETEGKMGYDVVLRSVETQMVASLREVVEVGSAAVTEMFERLEAAVAQYKARAVRPPLMIYHDAEYQEGVQEIEVAVPINRPLPTDGDIIVRELACHETMACCIHTGDYDTLPQAFGALMQWIEANDYHIVGPTREVFLRFGAGEQGYALPAAYVTDDAAEFVTELQVPVEGGDMGDGRLI